MRDTTSKTRARRWKLAVLCTFPLALAGLFLGCQRTQGENPASPNEARAQGGSVGDGGVTAAPTIGESALTADETPTAKLVAFRSKEELERFVGTWKESLEAQRHPHPTYPMNGPSMEGGAPPMASAVVPKAPSPSPATTTAPAPARARAAADAPAKKEASESITNNQHADVDEGDIVKMHGDHLVVLRRGRIFTVSLEGGKMKQSGMLDAFGPDIDPRGSWYDEMLVDGDNVVVIGFSYQRGGTEIGIFSIDAAGSLRYRTTYHMRSNDYYSARNYASRIVNGRLVFYAPTYISPYEADVFRPFPAVRRWRRGAEDKDFIRTLAPTRLYHVANETPPSGYMALHTVTSCDLRGSDLSCDSVGMIGPAGRVFYVSENNVYVWMRDWTPNQGFSSSPGVLAKMPIAPGSAVTAMRVAGMPTDQFSFEEASGFLNVLVRSESNGDAMWASEATSGDAAVMRVPLGLFSDGVPVASRSRYTRVPKPEGYSVQNRFIGPWLLYGAGNGYWTRGAGASKLYAYRYTTKEEPSVVDLDQGVDRIEAMGDNAVVIGSRREDLVFSPVELGKVVHPRRDYVRHDASQGELRSHGFFYKPSPDKQGDGYVGLPIRKEGARGSRYLTEGSAAVLFLENRGLELSELGSLDASPLGTTNDGCRASCVDWYGNARPIFARGRIFALMGYELVEGKVTSRGIAERARLSFAPRGGPPAIDDEGF